jgi:aspartate racemase
MKTLGLIGGISWVSTIDYYKLINEGINTKLGGLNFSRCIIYSFNYADIKKNNDANDWDSTLKMVTEASEHLKSAGATAIVLCANTMHVIAEKLEQKIGLPVIHIATVTAAAIKSKNIKKVGLLGTRFTMELDFFRDKLTEQGIETIIPADDDRGFIHYTIFEELGRGISSADTRQRYLSIIEQLIAEGAGGIILGCTEIPLLIQPGDVPVPVFDTIRIHAAAAVDFALDAGR